MEGYLTRLNDLRKEYPIAGYIIIAASAAMIVLSIIQISVGSYIPLIIGCILFIFFIFILIVASSSLKSRIRGFHFFLSAAMLGITSTIFIIWLVLLTLAAFNFICVPWMSSNCATSGNVTTEGYLQPQYSVVLSETESVPFEHYRSSCEDRSYGIHRVCLPDEYQVTSANTEGFWAKNNNGTLGSPTVDPQNSNCAVVEWSAASGGRTGIGECRYHGHIKFTMNVHGNRVMIEPGQRFAFSKSLIERELYTVAYPDTQPPNVESIAWAYSIEIARENNLLKKILAWISGDILWATLQASSTNPTSACLSSTVQDQTLVAVVKC